MPAGLWADAHGTLTQQYRLGLLNLGILLLATRFSPPGERRQVWIAVAIATTIECFNTFVWGVYAYRFHNLPLYVPTGHGLVYLFALRAARTPLMRRHGRTAGRIMLGAATLWALAGLTVEPLVTGRPDIAGALLWPVFFWFTTRRAPAVYAAAFFIASLLELCGTGFGNWTWAATTPWLSLPSGNPPSVIAAVYCWLDAVTLAVAWRLALLVARPVPAVSGER